MGQQRMRERLPQRTIPLGNRYEQLALDMLRDEGVTIRCQQLCVELAGVPGHIDAIGAWPDGRHVLIEVKSGGKRSVDDFAANGLQFARSTFVRGYYSQVQAYLAALSMDEAMVVYCERPDGQAEDLASLRSIYAQACTDGDPLTEYPVRLTRVERGYVQRSDDVAAGRLLRARRDGVARAMDLALLQASQRKGPS